MTRIPTPRPRRGRRLRPTSFEAAENGWTPAAAADRRLALNLISGVGLALNHPNVPTCAECQEWWYDPKDWKIVERPKGVKLKRPPNSLPCVGCPKSMEANRPRPDRELGPEGRAALEWHYLCEADSGGNIIARDAVTVQNNALIRRLIEQSDRSRADLAPILLGAMVEKGKR